MLALREVDDPGGVVDEREANSDKGVSAPRGQTREDELEDLQGEGHLFSPGPRKEYPRFNAFRLGSRNRSGDILRVTDSVDG